MTAYVASPMNSHPRTGLNYVLHGRILFILSLPFVVLGAKLIVSLSYHIRPNIISEFIFTTRGLAALSFLVIQDILYIENVIRNLRKT